LHAGLQVFGTYGYANTSISDVCRAAGVTTRHFYEEFASREALLIATYDETIQRLFGA
jgi:AcrR family transcriptional regulator